MKKRAVMILITVVLGFSSVMSPVCYAAAEESAQTQEEAGGQGDGENEDKSLLEKGAEIGNDLYDKMDEKLDSVDKVSLRKEIREALEQMDEMGISPSVVFEKYLGIEPASASESGKKPSDTLLEDAQRKVRKKTEGFFTILWNGFLDALEDMITTGISVFGSQKGNSAKGGSGL